ncbi:MAG: hypothetical protein AAGM38_18980, partial [Pseudomonadota bacterium]
GVIEIDGPGRVNDVPGSQEFIGDDSQNWVGFDETWEQVAVSRQLDENGEPTSTIIVEKLDESGDVIPGETDFLTDVEVLVFAGAEGYTNGITLPTDQIPDDGRRALMASSVGSISTEFGRSTVNSPAISYLPLDESGAFNGELASDDQFHFRAGGGDLNDTIEGTGDDDRLLGGDGGDYLEGNGGDDVLEGGDGSDDLLGGAGDDILVPGSGNDIVEGDAGVDTAVFEGDPGDYDIYLDPDFGAVIVDAKGGADVLSGINWLEEVEVLQFGFGA